MTKKKEKKMTYGFGLSTGQCFVGYNHSDFISNISYLVTHPKEINKNDLFIISLFLTLPILNGC